MTGAATPSVPAEDMTGSACVTERVARTAPSDAMAARATARRTASA
jgi:hypothetical protein